MIRMPSARVISLYCSLRIFMLGYRAMAFFTPSARIMATEAPALPASMTMLPFWLSFLARNSPTVFPISRSSERTRAMIFGLSHMTLTLTTGMPARTASSTAGMVPVVLTETMMMASTFAAVASSIC